MLARRSPQGKGICAVLPAVVGCASVAARLSSFPLHMSAPLPLRIHRLNPALPLPSYGTAGAVALDLYVSQDTTIAPHSLALVPNGVVVQVPAGHALLLCSRSSTPGKKQLHTPHGLGVIDIDYSGPQDELRTQVYNPTDVPVELKMGDRISQALVVPAPRLLVQEVTADELGASRGGFGTTGR